MKKFLTLALSTLLVVDVLATCGGGGGGGTGGMSGGTAAAPEVYPVPWKLINSTDAPPAAGLVVYWFPASTNELQNSSLRNSRALSLYASQCVTMAVADASTPLGPKFLEDAKPPVAVLADTSGKVVGKALGKDGKLRVDVVEKLVSTEMKTREDAVKEQMKTAKDAAKKGEKDAAIAGFKSVVDQSCLFPKHAKDATSELKKLGIAVPEAVFASAGTPVFDPAKSAAVEKTLLRGLAAENNSKYPQAAKLYLDAHNLDPADPAPLRYLGEVYRHHLGDWKVARAHFDTILSMPADPLSRAVALHGLGKMTIHDGEFKKGLALMEKSIEAFPLALTYRNLAVYWNSEGEADRGNAYTQKAIALDPNDPYNQVFAAVFLAAGPDKAAALKIAKKNESLMSASYNIAAIYAQLGERDKALAFLKRHFYEYERYDAVREKEMMEARVDAVFVTLYKDAAFVDLTKLADGKQMFMK